MQNRKTDRPCLESDLWRYIFIVANGDATCATRSADVFTLLRSWGMAEYSKGVSTGKVALDQKQQTLSWAGETKQDIISAVVVCWKTITIFEY